MRLARRIEDSEVLFVTLTLVLGEPPRPPESRDPRFSATETKLAYIKEQASHANLVKSWMAELGHDPHQGLYTSYMYWWREEWRGQKT